MTNWEELRKILDKEFERIVTAEREKLKVSGPYPLVADEIWKINTIPNYQQAIQTISKLRCEGTDGTPSGTIP